MNINQTTIDKIALALMDRVDASRSGEFDIVIKKSGRRLHIKQCVVHSHHVNHRHYHGSLWYEVTGDGIDGVKRFKYIGTLAKAIAYGIIG